MAIITSVEILHGRAVHLVFADGSVRVVDLAPFLGGSALGRQATDDDLFRAVRVDPVAGTIVWPDGADLDSDVLHGDFAPSLPSGYTVLPSG